MRALLSVANREGISTFARELQRLGVELFATDGTRDHLAADGIEVASVSDLTAVPPLVGGQVRTFHPAIYAGILARRDVPAQLEELKAHGLELLDLVVVNVKSFAPEVGRGHIGIDEAIEMIDVAGAALLGARRRATPPGSWRSPTPGTTSSSSTRCGPSGRSRPTRAIAWPPTRSRRSPPTTPRSRPTSTRSAATPTRSASRWCWRRSRTCPTARTPTSGRPSTARRPTARARSRTRPRSTGPRRPSTTCSTSTPPTGSPPTTRRRPPSSPSTPTRSASPRRRSSSRPTGGRSTPTRSRRSAGSSGSTASWTARPRRRSPPTPTRRSSRPGFSQAARGILEVKPGLELLSVPASPTEGMRDYGIANLDFKRVGGGLLVEALDAVDLDRGQLQVVTRRHPTLGELTDLLFAWRAVRHVRSNAIVLARNGATVGIGAAQSSRNVSVDIALRKAGDRAKLAVMASDAYFPFPDGIQVAANAGRHRDHPAGRLDPRRDGDRGRRPAPPRDGVHRPPPLPPLRRAGRSSMEQLLALEMVRVTEAAAIASARFMGRGDRHEADRAATEAMRRAMDETDIAGTIVIGEGERDEAPMLYIGEQVGPPRRRRGRGRGRRHRGRPARGHEPRRDRAGRRDHGARRLGAGRPDARAGHLPREAVRRARSPRAAWTSPGRRPRTATGSPRRSGAASRTSR